MLAALCGMLAAALIAAPPADARVDEPTAALNEVTGFGENPSNLQMYLYVPDNVADKPAVVVAPHWCGGSGPAMHSTTEYASLADQHGYIVVYPSVTRDTKCFDVSSPEALRRDGGSDPVGIKSMVDWVTRMYDADTSRIFATGISSGGMMTNVLLAVYPDVFKAGASFAGVPFGCFANADGTGWNHPCANGDIDRTPQEWGDLVRAAYPGYNGPRPRMQVWHGTEDDVLCYPNFKEQIEQWTNVLGVGQEPAATDSPQSTWTRTRYGGTGDQAPVEGISLQGVGHPDLYAPGMAARVLTFFGITNS